MNLGIGKKLKKMLGLKQATALSVVDHRDVKDPEVHKIGAPRLGGHPGSKKNQGRGCFRKPGTGKSYTVLG